MGGKQTYWIADPSDGTKAMVEGVEERDRWVQSHGWQVADEPVGLEFVWVTNENPELGPARLNWQAATDPAWAARGWSPGAPVEPVNTAIPPERAAEERAAAEKARKASPAAEPAEKSTRKSATSGESKE